MKVTRKVTQKTAKLKRKLGQTRLGSGSVGNNSVSQIYVRNKERSALAAGFSAGRTGSSEKETSQEELLSLIETNQNSDWYNEFSCLCQIILG